MLYSASALDSFFSRASSVSTSASVTTMSFSTSRSRSRARTISWRISSRNLVYFTPSFSSVARKSVMERLFSCAMRSMVRSSVASSTLMPVSFASWTCSRSLIMRSRIWRDSTSEAGIWVPWRCSCFATRSTRTERSFCVITSSFTTATMRSTGATRDAAGGARRGSGRGARACAGAPAFAGAAACAGAGAFAGVDEHAQSAAAARPARRNRKDAGIMERSRRCGGSRRCSAVAFPAG